MTIPEATPTPYTVQSRSKRKLPKKLPARGRLNYRSIMRSLAGEPKGKSISDPAVEGLRWRRTGKTCIVAEWRWEDRTTGERCAKTLGSLPYLKEIRQMVAAFTAERYEKYGENGLNLMIDGEAFVEKLRNDARKMRALLLAGHDPASEIGPDGMTLRQAYKRHKEKMENKGKSPLSVAEYDLALSHLNDWADVPLRRFDGKVGREKVRDRHLKIGKTRGKGAADKTMRAMRAWWNTARREDPDLGEAPTANVAWFNLKPRKVALRTRDYAQFGRELEALRREGRHGELRADYLGLMLVTGMRRTACAQIRREHVDVRERTIFVPAPKGGEGAAFTLPLSDAGWAIVQRRLDASNSPWLFPSPADPEKHISDVRADGVFSRHGLRATFIGAGHAAGVSDRYVMLLANHALHKGDVHGGYVPEDDIPAMAAATQKITDYLRKHGLPL